MLARLVACLLLVLPAGTPSARTFDYLVVVGDSLSDPGNLFAITSALAPLGLQPVPSPPYVEGRFSNGPVWVEGLAAGLGLSGPAVVNLATGGARTTSHLFVEQAPEALGPVLTARGVLSLREQVDLLVADGLIGPGGLHVVWGGANDFLNGPALEPSAPPPARALAESVTSLAAAGARTFLVPNLPDLGAVPRFVNDPVLQTTFAAASAAHNALLSTLLADLRTDLGLEIFELDVGAVTATLPTFGFANVTVPCALLPSCEGAAFFDDIHPTTAVHARLAATALATVPIPGAVVLFGSALVGLGWMRCRRRETHGQGTSAPTSGAAARPSRA